MPIFVRVDIGQLLQAGPTKRFVGETHLSMIATMFVISDCIPGWLHSVSMVLGKSAVHSSHGVMNSMRTLSTKAYNAYLFTQLAQQHHIFKQNNSAYALLSFFHFET